MKWAFPAVLLLASAVAAAEDASLSPTSSLHQLAASELENAGGGTGLYLTSASALSADGACGVVAWTYPADPNALYPVDLGMTIEALSFVPSTGEPAADNNRTVVVVDAIPGYEVVKLFAFPLTKHANPAAVAVFYGEVIALPTLFNNVVVKRVVLDACTGQAIEPAAFVLEALGSTWYDEPQFIVSRAGEQQDVPVVLSPVAILVGENNAATHTLRGVVVDPASALPVASPFVVGTTGPWTALATSILPSGNIVVAHMCGRVTPNYDCSLVNNEAIVRVLELTADQRSMQTVINDSRVLFGRESSSNDIVAAPTGVDELSLSIWRTQELNTYTINAQVWNIVKNARVGAHFTLPNLSTNPYLYELALSPVKSLAVLVYYTGGSILVTALSASGEPLATVAIGTTANSAYVGASVHFTAEDRFTVVWQSHQGDTRNGYIFSQAFVFTA